MGASGFAFVDGDARRGIAPATARHWAICLGLVVVAQWILARTSDVTNFIVRVISEIGFSAFAGGSDLFVFASIAWLVFPFGAVALLTFWLSRKFDNRDPNALGLNASAVVGGLPWILVGLVAAAPILAKLYMLAPGWHGPTLSALAWLIPATLIQSGAEEILFRGALLAMLVARYGARNGVLISAALFAIWHIVSNQGIIDLVVIVPMTFIFGVTSAILVLHQGHLGGAIALHLIWNLVWSIDAGTSQWSGYASGGADSFWQSYVNSYFTPWTLADLQDPATRSGLIFPLLIETLIVFGACRETFHKVFSPNQSLDQAEPN